METTASLLEPPRTREAPTDGQDFAHSLSPPPTPTSSSLCKTSVCLSGIAKLPPRCSAAVGGAGRRRAGAGEAPSVCGSRGRLGRWEAERLCIANCAPGPVAEMSRRGRGALTHPSERSPRPAPGPGHTPKPRLPRRPGLQNPPRERNCRLRLWGWGRAGLRGVSGPAPALTRVPVPPSLPAAGSALTPAEPAGWKGTRLRVPRSAGQATTEPGIQRTLPGRPA